MIHSLQYHVVPHGVIKSGHASIQVDFEKGSLAYDATVKVKSWFFSKTIPLRGSYTFDPEDLKSANIEVGKKFSLGQVSFTVDSIEQGVAGLGFRIPSAGGPVRGDVWVQVMGPYCIPQRLLANATVKGIGLKLELVFA